jgi:pumilio RNA-binding family
MIQFGREEDRRSVIVTIRSDLCGFALHKFASNVVEKCLQYGAQDSKQFLIDEIIHATGPKCVRPSARPHRCSLRRSPLWLEFRSLIEMVRDQYANYVVQKVIDLATQKQLSIIIETLRPSMAQLKKCTYGKHILTRLEKATGEKF